MDLGGHPGAGKPLNIKFSESKNLLFWNFIDGAIKIKESQHWD